MVSCIYIAEGREDVNAHSNGCRPEGIAEAVLFLASPESAYIVGTEVSVDGGMSQL